MTDREITEIFIHCAYTPTGMFVDVAKINEWHAAKDFIGPPPCGYHYVIRDRGFVEDGRPESMVGAHVRGHNTNSIGICLVGGKPYYNFNKDQMAALVKIVRHLRNRYPNAKVRGHNEVNSNKSCPTFDVQVWFADNFPGEQNGT